MSVGFVDPRPTQLDPDNVRACELIAGSVIYLHEVDQLLSSSRVTNDNGGRKGYLIKSREEKLMRVYVYQGNCTSMVRDVMELMVKESVSRG